MRRHGFTLIELLLALVIVATALVSLGAAMSQGIGTAADAINQRAAREACRTLLEQAVANGETSGGGPVPGHEQLTYQLTREQKMAGASDSPDEKYDILTVTVTYPSDQAAPQPGQSTGSGQIKFSTIVDPPDLAQQGGAGGAGGNPPR